VGFGNLAAVLAVGIDNLILGDSNEPGGERATARIETITGFPRGQENLLGDIRSSLGMGSSTQGVDERAVGLVRRSKSVFAAGAKSVFDRVYGRHNR